MTAFAPDPAILPALVVALILSLDAALICVAGLCKLWRW